MPIPVSLTDKARSPCRSKSAAIVIRPPAGVNFREFDKRLARHCLSFVGSANTVSANAGNLFQGTLVVSTLLPSRSKWHITLSLGLLASLVGSLDIMSWFIPFLLFLGVATPPVAGIYVADYWLYRRQGYDPERLEREPKVKRQGFAAWILGSLFGGLTIQGALSLTGIPSLDSLLISAVVFVLLTRCRSRREGGATS